MTTAEKRIKEAYERKNHTCFTDLVKKVEAWAEEKDLLHAENAEKQFLKFIEEVFEFKTELDLYLFYKSFKHTRKDVDFSIETVDRYENLKMEMGDILVTLIILSKQLDIDLVECLEMAYEKIKGRKGKTVDGIFLTEEYWE